MNHATKIRIIDDDDRDHVQTWGELRDCLTVSERSNFLYGIREHGRWSLTDNGTTYRMEVTA